MSNSSVDFLYDNAFGRGILCIGLKLKVFKHVAAYLNSPLSKWQIPGFIKKNNIDMSDYPQRDYKSYGDFFSRRKEHYTFDRNANHFISPCDGLLSTYSIKDDSVFEIKGSYYSVNTLLGDNELCESFSGGLCLTFRLTPADYHHYIIVDDGFIGKEHYIEGELHSVQPVACRHYPIYKLNRRAWNLIETENFGKVVQIEVGAMAVGGIVNEKESCPVCRGDEAGHFSLCGSTVVLFVQKGCVKLLPEFEREIDTGMEFRVRMGEMVGEKNS